MSNGEIRTGLYGKAIAESNGDEAKAKALYIKMRVASLIDEIEAANEAQEQVARQKIKEKLMEQQIPSDEEIQKKLKLSSQIGAIFILILLSPIIFSIFGWIWNLLFH